MNIEEARKLKCKAEADIARILAELVSKVGPSRIGIELDVQKMTCTGLGQAIASVDVLLTLEL